ncbi:hypothetical protein IFM12275_24340 [Nocardia sputorum]|uniref:hypothetical protein n=1 Tax=Nocardia sputorum TaxID=2984338 RepID=UPI00249147C7|nr:hypothetical protein [Nocardia sputorum]BDT92458.1 hypothetical protein IFM12275_24340 [Nocardia sputorum]
MENLWAALRGIGKRLVKTFEEFAGTEAQHSRKVGQILHETAESLEEADRAAARLLPHGHTSRPLVELSNAFKNTRYAPTEGEVKMRTRRLVGNPQSPWGKPNSVLFMESEDGGRNIYKPASGEPDAIGSIPRVPGAQAKREVAAYRFSKILGFDDLVPDTALVNGPSGPGSLQEFVTAGPAKPISGYDQIQRQRMAVFDYLTGNLDRNTGNYLTRPDGRIIAIDHGLTFPETTDPIGDRRSQIMSDFVYRHQNSPLTPEILESVRSVDPNAVRIALQDLELGDDAIAGTLRRLEEIQRDGMISGKSHFIAEPFWTEEPHE